MSHPAPHRRRPIVSTALALAGVFGVAAPVAAQSYTWNNNAGGNWSVPANWLDPANNPNVPPSANTTQLVFGATGATSYTATNDLAGTFTLNRLTVNNTGTGTVTIAGNPLDFAGATPTIAVTAGNALFTGTMAGAPTVTKTGAGTFRHDSNNTGFTGVLIINGGTFVNQATVNAVSNFNPTSIVVNSGGTYQFGDATVGDPNLPNATYITVNTGGTVNWQEGETFGGFNLQGGTINFQDGGVTASGAAAQAWTSGTLTGQAFSVAGAAPIDKTTAGTVTISGAANITITGSLNIQEGTIAHVGSANLGTAPVALGAAATAGTFEYQGASATRAGAFTINAGGGTVRVTSAAANLTLTGALSGTGGLTKDGPGALTLTGALGQTGTTTVTAGTLRVNPVTAAGGFTVANGATLAVNSGAGTASLSAPTLTLGNTSSTIQFELGTAVLPTVPLVVVSGANGLNASGGTHTLRVLNSQAIPTGTFTLIDYNGAGITTGFAVQLPGRTAGSLVFDTTNTRIDLTVTGTDSIRWRGNVSNVWDVGTAPNVGGTNNWQLVSNSAATNFINSDTTTFDDTALTTTVSIPAAVQPASVTVNTAATYTFQGAGPIAGTGGLTKQGAGTLILANDNTYTGTTTIAAGTVQVGNGGTTGAIAGPVSVAGTATLAFNRSNDLTYTGVMSGTGAITKAGAGTVIQESDSAGFTGTLTINAGRFLSANSLGGTHNFNPTSIVVNSGGTYQFGDQGIGNPNLPNSTYITINAGGQMIWEEGEVFGGFILNGGSIDLRIGDINIAGTTPSELRSGTMMTAAGAAGIVGTAAVNKTTAGTVTLTNTPITSTGGVNIQEGILATDSGITGTGDLTFGAAATAGTLRYTGASGAFDKTVVVNAGGGTVEVTQAATALTSTGIISGAGALAKTGPGSLFLNAVNTATGPVQVTGGTLGGGGTIAGPVTVGAGANLRGGIAAGTGTLTLTNGLTLGNQAGIAVRITNGSTPSGTPGGSTQGTLPNPTSNTYINVTGGTLTVAPADIPSLRFIIDGTGTAFTVNQAYSYQFGQVAGQNLSAINITNQAQFTPVGFAATNFAVTGNASGALFVSFTPVPEPATVLSIAAAGLGAGAWIRRRRHRRM